jgi:hypothetical protein
MRSESMSPTLSATTSAARSPAPPAFAGAGSCGAERRPILRPRCCLQQLRHFLGAQHRRQPARIAHDGKPARQVRSVERHREEEAQCCNCAVDAWRLHADLRLVQLEAAQVFRRRRVGRPADEGREGAHMADIIAPRVILEATHAHVFDHARP